MKKMQRATNAMRRAQAANVARPQPNPVTLPPVIGSCSRMESFDLATPDKSRARAIEVKLGDRDMVAVHTVRAREFDATLYPALSAAAVRAGLASYYPAR